MKGLLYKEWCLGRKTFFSFAVLAFIFAVIGMLIALSMICGNLQFMPTEDPKGARLFVSVFYYVPYCTLLTSAECCLQSIFSDYKSGWITYSYTFPIEAKKMVLVRYIVFAIVDVIAIIFGILNAIILSKISGYELTADIIKNLFILLIAFGTFDLILLPMSLKLKKASTISTISVILGMAVYFCFIGIAFHFEKIYGDDVLFFLMNQFETFRDKFLLVSPIYIALAVTSSLAVSVKICHRGER